MSFKLNCLLFVIVSIFQTTLSASEKTTKLYSEEVVRFEINPSICVVEKMGDDCHLQALVHWQTKQLMNVCLFKEGTQIQCWKEKDQIEETLSLLLTESTEVYMADQNNFKLAAVDMIINSIIPKNKRRRLRSAWGVF